MNERRKTFGALVEPTIETEEFQPRPINRPDVESVRKVAEAGGYSEGQSSRRPGDTQRRYRTGRTEQLNLKVTQATKEQFQGMADQAGISMNALFERAVMALAAVTKTEP